MFPKVHDLYLQWGRGAYLPFFRRHDESVYIEKISKLKKLQRYFCSPYLLHRFQMDLQSLIHKNKIKLIIHASGVNTCMQHLAAYI